MKRKNLIGVVVLAILMVSGAVQAGDNSEQNVINHNLSKRPYQEAPGDTSANKADNWEGATLVTKNKEATEVNAGPTKYQQLRIRMLGRTPYMEGK